MWKKFWLPYLLFQLLLLQHQLMVLLILIINKLHVMGKLLIVQILYNNFQNNVKISKLAKTMRLYMMSIQAKQLYVKLVMTKLKQILVKLNNRLLLINLNDIFWYYSVSININNETIQAISFGLRLALWFFNTIFHVKLLVKFWR